MSKADVYLLRAGPTSDPDINEATRRWEQAGEWEATARQRFMDDLKFAEGDSENNYQWPDNVRASRSGEARPTLTMNIIRQHNFQISNEARRSKSSVNFVGTAGGATQAGANVLKDLMRKVEYQSNAQAAYTKGRKYQIDGGIGWWRLYTDYADETTFDQEIFIGQVNDPLSVYMDCNIQRRDGLDANWAFVFDTLPEEQIYEQYNDLESLDRTSPLGTSIGTDEYVPKGHIMVAEYFRRIIKPDVLLSFVHKGDRLTIPKSSIPQAVYESLCNDPLTRRRSTHKKVVEWMLIAGQTIIDKTIWPGQYIPLIRCIGEETIIDGIMDRKGHTRAMKDSQKMFNYNASAQVEFVALQGKTPWVAPAKAIEEHEEVWNTANIINHSVLPYNHIDDEGQPIPPPQRTAPPTASPAYQQGMDTAFLQMQMVSGQYQNSMGQQGNERTGAAIRGTQGKGETSTYHLVDNFEEALITTGKMFLDLVPHVYNTKRVFQILGEDGKQMEVQIDPTQKQAVMTAMMEEGQAVSRIFNPTVGSYDVAASVGPAYGTRRQENQEMISLIMTQNPQIAGLIGDLLFASMDFDKAQEVAQRLRRMVPPQALGQGPTPKESALMQNVNALQQELSEALDETALAKNKLVGKEQMRDIDAYEAETKRMVALKDALLNSPEMQALLTQLVSDAMATAGMNTLTDANANNIDIDNPSPGSSPGNLNPSPSPAAPAPGAPSGGQ